MKIPPHFSPKESENFLTHISRLFFHHSSETLIQLLQGNLF